MRKIACAWDDHEARELLRRQETLHLASSTPDGTIVLRALHAVLVGDVIAFHGSKAGEKKLCLGRKAVVSAETMLASIPSYFVDPEQACPATSYYESAQATGVLEVIDDLAEKEKVIAALMNKYQPEGGYAAIDARSPMYQKTLRGLLVYGLRIDSRDSSAWVGCVDEEGRLVGSARALGDGRRFGWVLDMVVHPNFQGKGWHGTVSAFA